MTAGTDVSKPTTSSMPRSFGSARVKPLEVMPTTTAEYVRENSDAAFGELVSRYLNLVYSTAFRLVSNDAHFAQDVTQTVFTDLARMAHALSPNVMLGGWLHRHTWRRRHDGSGAELGIVIEPSPDANATQK